jgi:cold shock CspA family protein
MARSQETFNKKEVRNKKEKKRKEKAEKRAAKKDAGVTNTFDEMIAYVDEFGNISNTPPDPTKKKEIVKAEDIELGVPKRESLEDMDPVRKGVVTFFNDSKGYGFINDSETQESVFVHINNVEEEIKENNMVTFEVEMGPKGPTAMKVKLNK